MKNIKFADQLKNMIAELLKVDRKTLEYYKNFYYQDNNGKQIFIRQLMLNLGTDIVREGKDGKNPFIKQFLQKDITQNELNEFLLKKMFYLFDINQEKLILKDINDKSKIKIYDFNQLKKSFLLIINNFINKYQKALLSTEDIWNSIVKNNIPNDKLSVITDARFEQEFNLFINDKDLKDRVDITLIIKQIRDESGRIVSWIENQGKRIDNELLYYLYNNANNLKELETEIQKNTGLPPAESLNVIFTLYAIKKLNNQPLNSKIDLILNNNKIIQNMKIWNFRYGIQQKDIVRSKKIQGYLKNRKNNGILVLAGCSGNGKDYVFDAIEQYNAFHYISLPFKKEKFEIDINYEIKINNENQYTVNNIKINLYLIPLNKLFEINNTKLKNILEKHFNNILIENKEFIKSNKDYVLNNAKLKLKENFIFNDKLKIEIILEFNNIINSLSNKDLKTNNKKIKKYIIDKELL